MENIYIYSNNLLLQQITPFTLKLVLVYVRAFPMTLWKTQLYTLGHQLERIV